MVAAMKLFASRKVWDRVNKFSPSIRIKNRLSYRMQFLIKMKNLFKLLQVMHKTSYWQNLENFILLVLISLANVESVPMVIKAWMCLFHVKL